MSESFSVGNPMKMGTTPPPKSPSTDNRRSTSISLETGEREPVKVPRPSKDPKPSLPPKKPSRNRDASSTARGEKAELRDVELGSASENVRSRPASVSVSKREREKERDRETDSASQKTSKGSNKTQSQASRFKGANPLQYTLWAHFMAYGSSLMCLCMGIFSMAWTKAETYGCRIDGRLVHSSFLYAADGSCPTRYTRPSGEAIDVCCSFDAKSDLQGFLAIGAFYVVYSVFILVYENASWGWGLYYPNDTFCYRNRVSPVAAMHLIVGAAGLYNYATCLAGACLVATAVVMQYGVYRNEAGDGGREANRLKAQQRSADIAKRNADKPLSAICAERCQWLLSFNPVAFYRRIYSEDKLSSYVWVGIYLALNVALFIYTLDIWYETVEHMRDALLDGSLDVTCSNALCHVNRKAVKYGPISLVAPWAKGCGVCLNLNCALLLLPVVRMLLRKLHNYGSSYSSKRVSASNDLLNRFFAHPLTRYLPLQKNIEFHKICAVAIFFLSWGHLICHFVNLIYANNITMRVFRFARWDGTDFFTGALATYSMFFIYSAAPDVVRLSKYEIFFKAHHFFVVFFVALFLHGPSFFYWTAAPVLLYIAERYMQVRRGNRPYVVIKAEWISPVLALYFRPVHKEDFVFQEGQYLYLNCPAISPSEWHPFTISSASDDLATNPTRICVENGEEVIEVPRPKSLPPNAKWNKYCLASQDWTKIDPNEYLDKADTGYFDYVSLHIKVFGLEEPHARSWTRKLKEYLELLSPGKKFPFYFSRRDARGDVHIGKQFGPDGKTPILCVDGPHSAPAEHYANYGTLMLIGAGIGLTPCVSILTSLTKYRWKKNFNPEILHFYWIVRQNEVEAFQWLVHLLTENSFELKRSRASNQIDRRYYCEINIYVTGCDSSGPIDAPPLYRPKKPLQSHQQVSPSFSADQLYELMLNPPVNSKDQTKKMKDSSAPNRLQDIWVWNGRPHWDEIFKEMRNQRQHSEIGVCFCGAPAIGADLRSMCEKYSSVDEDCLFSLHKENF